MARLALILVVLGLFACDQTPEERAPAVYQRSLPPLQKYVAPARIQLAEAPTHRVVLTEPQRIDECFKFFEPQDQVVSKLPWSKPRVFESLLGCRAEAWLESTKQGLYVAYGVPLGEGKRNMRIVAFDHDGAYRWSALIDRTGQGKNFVANYRDAFLTEVGDKHICAGTRWEGGTQATCMDPKTGEIQWNGRMSFWAGMKPTGGNDAFYVADLSSLTRRYPYSGVEMRYEKLDGTGGRAAVYAGTSKHLYFAPSRAEEPRLVRYDLGTMTPTWRTALPAQPAGGYAAAFDEHQVVLLKIDTDLIAIDTETGAALWQMNVGQDRPTVASNSNELVILHHVPDVPNPIFGISPKTGKIRWQAVAPVGTLNVLSNGQQVIVMGIRATQVIERLEAL